MKYKDTVLYLVVKLS